MLISYKSPKKKNVENSRKLGEVRNRKRKKTINFKKNTAMFLAGMISKMLYAEVFWNAEYAKKRSERGVKLNIEVNEFIVDFSLCFLRNFAYSASRFKKSLTAVISTQYTTVTKLYYSV